MAQRLYEARRTALDRMTSQCARLGGHGIVGVSLQVTEVSGTDVTAAAIKFTAAGTAVRARGVAPLAHPFTCDLSGPDFAKLIMAGWVPAGIALGISVTGLHDDPMTTDSRLWGNAEVPSYTRLITMARQGARDHLQRSVQELGADGVVVSAMTLRVRSDPCRAQAAAADHFAEVVITGTAQAVATTEALGLDPQLFFDAIAGGPLDSAYAQMKGKAMIEGEFEPSFPLALAAKDAGLIVDAAEGTGEPLPLQRAVLEAMTSGVEAGHGDKDKAASFEAARPSSV